MDNRKDKLLNLVVDSYIETAEPVGSRFLLASGNLECGEATIRNELRSLEAEGYLTHPHTSAGRIPTNKGYRYYVDNLDKSKLKTNKKENDVLGMSVQANDEYLNSRKQLAKALVELSNQTIILAFSPDLVYYTGLANLFSQPEFSQLELVADVSQIFDHCENCLDSFFDQVDGQTKIFIGQEHPFGGMLSVVATGFKNDKQEDSLIALLGPARMNYGRNWALIEKIKEII